MWYSLTNRDLAEYTKLRAEQDCWSPPAVVGLYRELGEGCRRTQRQSKKELTMEQRLNYPRLAPEANRAMVALGSYLATCGLEHPLLELIKIRASQMNGCSFCIDMHRWQRSWD
jgi:Carboxymuconolactone decarboxylase family